MRTRMKIYFFIFYFFHFFFACKSFNHEAPTPIVPLFLGDYIRFANQRMPPVFILSESIIMSQTIVSPIWTLH